jgi:hypothetical protein
LFAVDDVPPAIAALTSGPELVIVFTNVDTKALYWTARNANIWTDPMEITGARSIEPVLLALPSGGAILAFRESGTNIVRWSRFNGTSWTAVMDVDAGATGKSRPALARGAGDAEAEIVYVDTVGVAQHARLQSGSFTAPIPVGGTNLAGVAIATNL